MNVISFLKNISTEDEKQNIAAAIDRCFDKSDVIAIMAILCGNNQLSTETLRELDARITRQLQTTREEIESGSSYKKLQDEVRSYRAETIHQMTRLATRSLWVSGIFCVAAIVVIIVLSSRDVSSIAWLTIPLLEIGVFIAYFLFMGYILHYCDQCANGYPQEDDELKDAFEARTKKLKIELFELEAIHRMINNSYSV
ncbi:hypothetical protein IJG91_02130 [Candidatus Saccharibacteria bacterium]|nr:hypothetical protein [Candidatus Saccharibacteria bacterium]